MRPLTSCAVVLCAAAFARADEPSPPDGPVLWGDVRAGVRLISGEGEGRFPQDVGLKDGPRLFDVHLFGEDLRPDATFDRLEARASGVGDPWTDYLVDLRRSGSLELSGGYRRDDANYRATGDFFSYDTIRERGFVHARWTLDSTTALRFTWDRDARRGDAWTRGHLAGQELSRAENPEDVAQVRPLSSRRDAFSLGADWTIEGFRFGLTQSAAVSTIDDDRFFEVPRSQNDGVPRRGAFENDIDATTWTTVAKVGASFLDRTLDATLFVTRTVMPLESRITDFERLADDMGLPTTRTVTQDLDIDRAAWTERIELDWRPWTDWEFAGAAEYATVADDTQRDYVRTSGGRSAFSDDAVVTNRNRRFSLDATWEAAHDVKLRLGEQLLSESLFVGNDRPLTFLPPDLDPADPASLFPGRFVRGSSPRRFETDAWRTTGGVDWKPVKDLTTSFLAHWTTDEHQQAAPTPHTSRDFSGRTRWQATEELSLGTQWRHVDGRNWFGVPYAAAPIPGHVTPLSVHDRFLLGESRSDSVSGTATWASGDWTVTGGVTWRNLATSAETAHFRGASYVYRTSDFKEHETIANADVRWDATKCVHLHTGITRTVAHGDLVARWLTASAGAAYDLAKDVTLGLDVLTWRLDDGDAPEDSYRTLGVEFWVTYRF
jgi:hypothetical protein